MIDSVIRTGAQIATVVLILIMVSICVEVVARYGFSMSIHGMHAIIEGLFLPAVVFFGAPLVGRMDGHMKVELFDLKRWPKVRRFRHATFAILVSLFWLVCGWQAALRAHEAFVLKQWPIGEIAAPTVISFGVTAIGCFLAACAHILPSRTPEKVQ